MLRFFDAQSQKRRVVVEPGELYVTRDAEIVSTVLGSCITVCLFDAELNIAGMNHYILPKRIKGGISAAVPDSARFGEDALLMLLEQVEKKGARRTRLTAKVFGGATMIRTECKKNCVAAENISTARRFLSEKNIRVAFEDVGGPIGRRIYFNTSDGGVLVQRIPKSTPPPATLQKKNERQKGVALKGICCGQRPRPEPALQSGPY
jgi:chemotaxis protein CheD